MRESEFVRTVRETGGRAYVVGGWVRDRVMGAAPRDKDYVLTGLDEGAFREAFPDAFKVGGGFPVYKLKIDGERRDVAFARNETKTGRGYRGFSVSFSADTSIGDDLGRRDTTINAMAVDLETGEMVDPYGGERDVLAGVIRAVSQRFTDDPVRALRAARQAARFGFRIEPGTITLMRACRDELGSEPAERLVKELADALACERPSIFFKALLAAGVLDVVFPRIYALAGSSSPGPDAFARLMEITDRASAMSGRIEVRFAALASGALDAEALREWNREITLPKLWVKCALFAIRERAVQDMRGPCETAALLERLSRHPIGFDGFEAVILAGGGDMPYIPENRAALLDAMASVKISDAPPGLDGEQIGAWLRARRAAAVSDQI
jgi:tRNA nucleotidyltransferase (CCA-adding enzyme)